MIRENYSNISTNWAKYVTLLAILFISHSCYKPKSTIATITVLNDSNNSPVSGATVRLFYDDPAGINTSIITINIIFNRINIQIIYYIIINNIC